MIDFSLFKQADKVGGFLTFSMRLVNGTWSGTAYKTLNSQAEKSLFTWQIGGEGGG